MTDDVPTTAPTPPSTLADFDAQDRLRERLRERQQTALRYQSAERTLLNRDGRLEARETDAAHRLTVGTSIRHTNATRIAALDQVVGNPRVVNRDAVRVAERERDELRAENDQLDRGPTRYAEGALADKLARYGVEIDGRSLPTLRAQLDQIRRERAAIAEQLAALRRARDAFERDGA